MKVAVIGGDKRMLFAAKAFSDRGYAVSVSGFDGLKSDGSLMVQSPLEGLFDADIVALPVPCVMGDRLNAPFSRREIRVSELSPVMRKLPVFCGMSEKLRPLFDGELRDYCLREDFQIKNAVLTAEGALMTALSAFEGSIFGAKTLVCGYGRIGKVLSRMLRSLGAVVTVAARKLADCAWAETYDMNVCDFSFEEFRAYDLIFNTVPFPILSADVLDRIASNAVVIDLASSPGGVDFDHAAKKEITAIHALSLPGKYAPKAAGEIITDTILRMIKEE